MQRWPHTLACGAPVMRAWSHARTPGPSSSASRGSAHAESGAQQTCRLAENVREWGSGSCNSGEHQLVQTHWATQATTTGQGEQACRRHLLGMCLKAASGELPASVSACCVLQWFACQHAILELLAELGRLCPPWRVLLVCLLVRYLQTVRRFSLAVHCHCPCGTDIMHPPGSRHSVTLPRLPAYAHHNRRSACRRAPQVETSLPKSP